MADSNRSSWDANDHRDNSGDTSRPPLPQPDQGDNVCPVPLWEREFCCQAYDIPWETFCENKLYIGLYEKIMGWDDSGARENFENAKERFRAKYFAEPFEEPVLDPDLYIDKCEQLYFLPNNANSNLYLGGSSGQGVDPGQTPSGTGVQLTGGVRMWITGTSGGGGGGRTFHIGGGSGNGGGMNLNLGSGSGSVGGIGVRIWNAGGSGGAIGGNGNNGGRGSQISQGGARGRGSNGNGGGRNNQRTQGEGQRQQRDGGSIHRNQDEERRQPRSGCCWPQPARRMEWRPVQHNRR